MNDSFTLRSLQELHFFKKSGTSPTSELAPLETKKASTILSILSENEYSFKEVFFSVRDSLPLLCRSSRFY